MLKKLVPTLAVAVAVAVVGTTVALAGTDPSVGSDGFGDLNFPQDGNGGYLVTHYDVALDYDPAKPDHLTGDATVHATTTQDLSRFDLDLQGFDVTSVTVNGTPAKAVQRTGDHELVITPAGTLRRNSHLTVRVRYTGAPGGHWMTYSDDGAVRALGEPRSASDWYPANDYPADKATMALAVTVPDGWAAVAGGFPGPITSGNGHTTFRYREDQPVAPHVTGLAIDRFTLHRSKLADGTPVLDAYMPGTEQLSKPQEDRLPEVLDFLSSKFGPYPFPSAGGIFTGPEPGLSGYELQQRPEYGTAITAEYFSVIVHENAHQWFGDSVTVRQWRDIAVAEAFATYAEWLWNEAKEGHDLDNDYRSRINETMGDPEFWSNPVDDPQAGFVGSYTVGPLMLHALRRTVGDTVFFQTLKDWNRMHRDGNASWVDFEKLARSESGTDLTGFFSAWAHSTTMPADQYLYPGHLRA